MRAGDPVAFTDAEERERTGVAWDRAPLVRRGWLDPWWLWLPDDGCFVIAARRRERQVLAEVVRLLPGQRYEYHPLHGWRVLGRDDG